MKAFFSPIGTQRVVLKRCTTRAIALAALLTAAGCSAVPDAVNPVEWYRGVSEWFESDDDRQNRASAKAAEQQAPVLPGTNRPYPNLSSVPERPQPTSAAERNVIARELAADRENARYTEPEPERRPQPFSPGLTPTASPRLPVTSAPAPAPAVEPRPPAPPAPRLDPGTDPTAPLQQVQPPRPQSSVPPVATQPLPAAGPQGAAPMPSRATVAPTPPARAAASQPQPTAVAQAQPQPSATAVPRSPAVAVAPPPLPPADRLATVERAFRDALAQSQSATTTRPVGPTATELPTSPLAPPQLTQTAVVPAMPPAPAAPATMPAAAPSVAPAAAALRPARVGGPATTIYFAHGSASLSAADRFALREAAALHKVHGGRVRVVGHASNRTANCDPQAREIANFRISSRRAEAVAAELARHGVPRANMMVSALADQGAVSCDATPEQEAEARRTEVFLDY